MSSADNNPAGQLAAAAAAAAAAQSNSPPQQTAQPSTSTQSVSSTTATAGDTSRCLWESCSERFPGPEALYDHICDRHIGRKSTNNLNLECHWANCKTKTVKRDHITSHVRVHVPFKPHRCPICNKSFKRPQDLKKHHKTHAEDSGPSSASHNGQGPNGHQGGHPGHNGYGGMGGPPGPGGFYPQMQGGVGMNFAGYQGPHGAYYAQPPQNMGAQYHGGGVYFPSQDGGPGTQASFARHGDSLQALNSLFGAIKQPAFDTSSYSQISGALAQMHGVNLPLPAALNGHYGAMTSEDSYLHSMPQLSNIRDKRDLVILQDKLQEMMNAIETHDRNAIPIAQMHSTAPSASLSTPHMPIVPHGTASSNEQTPLMTPDTGSTTYSPGHSPASDHSSMAHSSSSGVASYPALQGAMGGRTAAIPTLGTQYDHHAQQRHTGGQLQRAAPSGTPQTVVQAESSKSKARTKPKRERDANIDPALVGPASSSSSTSDHTATPSVETAMEEAPWLREVRMIEDLLTLVRDMLGAHQYQDVDQTLADDGSAGARSGDSDEMEVEKNDVAYPELTSLTK